MDSHSAHLRDIIEAHDDIVAFQRPAGTPKVGPNASAATIPAACGEGWYHDAAIAAAAREAIEARSNPYHH